MSRNRYGRIYHSDYNHINLRFESLDKRRIFEAKFNAYHAEHDHDGEAPRFEEVAASVIGNPESTTIHDAHSVSIDGYATYEIEEYHNRDSWTRRYRYKPPTCCVAPVISIDRTFIDSATLDRHELSSIFTDMPEEVYAALLESVEKDGFMDPVIRLLGTEVLDGWHRYRAAKELNLIRKLRFHQWDEKDEGDPAAFVYARNRVRRHLDKSRQAQITVYFNERYELGRNQYSDEGSSNDEPTLKSREELAKEAGVSTATIDRAIAVEKEGQSEAVISGEKTTGEVLKERDVAKLVKRKKQVIKNIWDMRLQAARDYTGEADTELNEYLTLPELEKGFAKSYETYRGPFESAMKRIDAAVSFENFQERCLDVDEYGNAKFNVEDLEKEYRALMTYSGDLRNWQREDWSPDTNWILPLIEAKKRSRADTGKSLEPSGYKDTSAALKQSQAATADTEDKSPSVSDLWDKIEKNTQAIRAAYTEVYQKGAVSVSEMFTAGIIYYNLPKEGLELSLDNPTGGYEDKKRLTRIEGVTARMLSDFTESRVKAGWIRKCLSNPAVSEAQDAEVSSVEDTPDMDGLWAAYNKRYPKWKAKYAESGYKENDLIKLLPRQKC